MNSTSGQSFNKSSGLYHGKYNRHCLVSSTSRHCGIVVINLYSSSGDQFQFLLAAVCLTFARINQFHVVRGWVVSSRCADKMRYLKAFYSCKIGHHKPPPVTQQHKNRQRQSIIFVCNKFKFMRNFSIFSKSTNELHLTMFYISNYTTGLSQQLSSIMCHAWVVI